MSIRKISLYFAPPALLVLALAGLLLLLAPGAQSQGAGFQLEEATIADVHRAIRAGQITCRGLVQRYVDRFLTGARARIPITQPVGAP